MKEGKKFLAVHHFPLFLNLPAKFSFVFEFASQMAAENDAVMALSLEIFTFDSSSRDKAVD